MLIDKGGTKSLALFIWSFALVVCIVATSWIGGLASGFGVILDSIDISNIIHYFKHDKWSSIFPVN